MKKVFKKNLRIMSKQYAHLHTMAKTSVKFQNDWPKTVGGVALTRHPLTIRVLGKKTTKLTKRKKLKKKSENYEQTICTSTRHGHNICEVSKRLAKNCRRSCAHKSIVDEWMNGRITARLYRTCVLTQVRQKGKVSDKNF